MANYYRYFFTYLLLTISIGFVQSQSNEIGITEKLSEHIPQDIWLMNEKGERINLLDEITIPTVLSFVYFNCPGICTPLMNEIQSLIDKSDLNLGEEYQVLTISFNPEDTTRLAFNKKKNYLKNMDKSKAAEDWWKFYTGDSSNIAKATQSVGFHYKRMGNDFIHKACMIIVNQEGKIIRYNMGINMLPMELKISIIEATKGNVLPKTYKKDEYCYPFIAPAYQRLNKIAKEAGIFIVIVSIALFIYLIVKPRRK